VVGGPAPVWNKTMSQEDLVQKQGVMTASQINSALQGMAVAVSVESCVGVGVVWVRMLCMQDLAWYQPNQQRVAGHGGCGECGIVRGCGCGVGAYAAYAGPRLVLRQGATTASQTNNTLNSNC
jgi:hypothetical protein